MSGRWNEEEEKTIRGIAFPTNGHDQLATGKKLRVLTVVDTFSRYVPVLYVRYSYCGEDVVATLTGSAARPAIPRRSASIRAASSSRATWTSGPTNAG